jgi:hypothetical protein
MVGFTLLSRFYYYLRRRSPGPPLPPDHRQARGTGGYNFLLKQTHGVDARPPRPEPRTSLASPQNRARMQPAQV